MEGCADRVHVDRSAICTDLAAEFAGLLPRSSVETEVRVAAAELAGQVPDGAVGELLHRLVECRLRQRVRGRA
jgi:hypothetical protein